MKKFFALLFVILAFSSACFAEGLKIAIVTSPNDVHDGGFYEDNYNGILDFLKDHPDSSVVNVVEKTGDPAACLKVVEDVAADYDVIICVGFQFSGISEIAEDNQDIKFVLVDTWPTDSNGEIVRVKNINAMTYREEEGGFLAGVAAALSSKTKKVAVVNGIAYPTNVNYQYGFMSGVNYSNKHFDTKVKIVELPSYSGIDVTGNKVGGNYIGSFIDQANGKTVGQALIREGCDVIFVAAGSAGMGVFTAAKEAKNVYVIGCDADQFKDGVNGKSNIILTSSLKIMGINNKRVLNEIAAGKFEGGNFLRGAAEDSIGYVKAKGRNQLSEEAIAKLDSMLEYMKYGRISPASSISGTKPDNFVGLNIDMNDK